LIATRSLLLIRLWWSHISYNFLVRVSGGLVVIRIAVWIKWTHIWLIWEVSRIGCSTIWSHCSWRGHHTSIHSAFELNWDELSILQNEKLMISAGQKRQDYYHNKAKNHNLSCSCFKLFKNLLLLFRWKIFIHPLILFITKRTFTSFVSHSPWKTLKWSRCVILLLDFTIR